MAMSIEIPLRDTDEVIELDLEQLPECIEVLGMLRQERPKLNTWVSVALAYYEQNKTSDSICILEAARTEADIDYPDYKEDQIQTNNMLVAYYMEVANHEKSNDKKRKLIMKAKKLINDC